jgi:imidazolonepropionase-like amidohydrolase
MKRLTTLALALALAAVSPAAAQERVAVKGGRVIPVAGPPIDGGVVLIRNGKVEAVGKGLSIPSDAVVIDAAGKTVIPGFVEAHSSRGMDQANEQNPNVPFLSVIDAIDPVQDYFEECRRNGVTTVAVMPGNDTMFGGQGAVIKTAGTFVDQMIVKRSAGLKISLKPTGQRNRMGQMAALRKELDAARDALAEEKSKPTSPATSGSASGSSATPKADDEQPAQPRPRRPAGGGRGGAGPQGPDSADAALVREALQKLLKGDVPALIYCELAMDVPQAIRLVQDYKVKAVLVLGQDCYKAVKQVAAAKLPVVLDPALTFWESDPRGGDDRFVALPKVYREAGVPVTFQVTGFAAGNLFRAPSLPPALGTNYLWYQAATAVKYGTPPEEALEAITLRPAQVLGVEKLVGSIEPGKDADLVILTGDPLKLDTWVEKTLVGGKVVYDREQDRKLKQLLKPTEKK